MPAYSKFCRFAAAALTCCLVGGTLGAAPAPASTHGGERSSTAQEPTSRVKKGHIAIKDLKPRWNTAYHFRGKAWGWKRGKIRMRLSVKGNAESSANVERKTCKRARKCRVTIGPTVSKDRGTRLTIKLKVRGPGGTKKRTTHKNIEL